MRIGLLEDNPALSEMMQITLDLAGHTTSVHSSGAAFLKEIFTAYDERSELPLDLAIIDLGLPSIPGNEVILSLRQTFSAKVLPIIVVSAASKEELEEVESAFALPVLRKPFKMRHLLDLITSMGIERRSQDETRE